MKWQGLKFQTQRIHLSVVLVSWSQQKRKQHQGGLTKALQAHCLGASANISWGKLSQLGKARRSILEDSAEFVQETRNAVKQNTVMCRVDYRQGLYW
jgi:hypothetical protein